MKKRAFEEKTSIVPSVYPEVNTAEAHEVQVEVERLFSSMFPKDDRIFISSAFRWAVEAFAGRFRDYQAIDARYHDFEHTLQGTLCLARLFHGRFQAGTKPGLSRRTCELALYAILLHDTGYLKKRSDRDGTGAKYTQIHVQRSVEFARELLAELGYVNGEIIAVENMIRCTGVNVDLSRIPFQNEEEQCAGMSLGTADLLGQMAAGDYIEKLPILYKEFDEARRHGMTSIPFKSADELIESTPGFWKNYVVPKIEKDFKGVYHFLETAPGKNPYVERIAANLARLASA
jgi:hypothetical protein